MKTLVACAVIVATMVSGASAQQAGKPGISVIIINPKTGETAGKHIPPDQDIEDGLRAAFGIIPKAEAAKLTKYVSIAEVEKQKPIACGYLVSRARLNFDPEGKKWSGVLINRGTIPIFERTSSGTLKIFDRLGSDTPAGMMQAFYIPAAAFSTDWQHARREGWKFYPGDAMMPKLCRTPADIVEKSKK